MRDPRAERWRVRIQQGSRFTPFRFRTTRHHLGPRVNHLVILWHYAVFVEPVETKLDGQPLETTLYSLSDAPPRPGDRREGERHLTLFRVGSIMIGDRRELCLIKNISAGGMMIRAYCHIAIGSALSIELKSGQPVTGSASWANDHNVGVAFDSPIDVIEILSASADGPRPRMPRVEVACIATLRDGANIYRLPVCDVSQGGLKVKGEPLLEHGCDLSVSLPGLPPQPAALRWRADGHLGISFNRLIPLAELVGWLQGVRDGMRAAS